jgi:glycosyltransferase involved in cell wall biosynthesis
MSLNLLLFNLRTDSADTALGFTTAWINALAPHCNRIHVVTMYAGLVEVAPNVHVHSIGKEAGLSEARRLVRFYRIVLSILRQEQIDVVFAHMAPLFAVLFAPIAKIRRIPVLLWYAHKSVPTMLRVAHALVDECVASTPEGFRLPSRKVSFIGQGVDTNVFAPPRRIRSGHEMTALAIGRVTPIKNLKEVVEAVALVREHGVDLRLRVVGGPLTDGDIAYEARVRRAAEGLGSGIDFRGPIPFTRIPDEYRQGGIFINLSGSGSLDKAILESMASGCIPICRNDAFRALAAEHGLSRLVPGDGAAAVAECMLSVIRQPEPDRRALRTQLRRIVVEHHSLDTLAAEVVGHLRGLAGTEHSSRVGTLGRLTR